MNNRDQFSSSAHIHHQLSLGNFQLPSVQFHIPNMPMPTESLPQFTLPALGASSGLGQHLIDTPSLTNYPLLFSPAKEQHHPSPSYITPADIALSELYIEHGAAIAHHVAPGIAAGLHGLSLVIKAYEPAHKIASEHESKTDVSQSQAMTCKTLGALAEAGTDYFLKTTAVSATVGGIAAAAAVAAAGVGTANPLLIAGGTAAGITFANLAAPAFASATDVAATVGEGASALCHSGFEQARQLSRGGR